MGTVVTKNQSWAVEIEDTEGTYKAPTASTSFVQTLADGAEMSRSKETIERNIFTSSIGKTPPRTGQFTASGSMPVEARANSSEGTAPEYDKLMRSGMGTRRQLASAVTTLTGNTSSVLKVTDASLFSVGDIILVKEAGAFHVSPISAVDTGTDEITLLVPGASAFSNGVVIAKHTTYTVADSGHPSLSISRYLESAVLQQTTGARVSTISLDGFSTGQLPSFNFGFEGLNFDSSLTAPPYTPSYDSQFPPIILAAKVFMDGTAIDVNELTMSIENTLGFQTSVSAENGRISGRPVERTVTGSFNPYMASDSMANYNKFKNNTAFSVFAYAKLPSTTAGEFSGIVAVYMPNCLITELSENDADGLLQDSISFSANRGADSSTNEVFITVI
jgi:hypothetical protein